MGNHSKCNGCGELDEFCLCKVTPLAGKVHYALERQRPDASLQAALAQKADEVLEQVAQWLDSYDGAGMRRAEYVRSLKTTACGQDGDASASATPGRAVQSPQAALVDCADQAPDSQDPAAVAEARRVRIVALRQELVALEAEQYGEKNAERDAVIAECRVLKRSGQNIQAIKHYRAKMGCGLSEARDFVDSLA